MKLYIVRHGKTDWNVARRLQGRADIPLNENGREIARKTAEGIRNIPIDFAISSPLSRAKETAEILVNKRKIPVYLDERLEEISFGVMEGQIKNEQIDHFFHSPEIYQPPKGAESIPHLLSRTEEFLEELASNPQLKEKNILIATHGAATRALLANIKHLSIKEFWSGSVPKNCGITLAECENGIYRIIWEDRIFYQEER